MEDPDAARQRVDAPDVESVPASASPNAHREFAITPSTPHLCDRSGSPQIPTASGLSYEVAILGGLRGLAGSGVDTAGCRRPRPVPPPQFRIPVWPCKRGGLASPRRSSSAKAWGNWSSVPHRICRQPGWRKFAAWSCGKSYAEPLLSPIFACSGTLRAVRLVNSRCADTAPVLPPPASARRSLPPTRRLSRHNQPESWQASFCIREAAAVPDPDPCGPCLASPRWDAVDTFVVASASSKSLIQPSPHPSRFTSPWNTYKLEEGRIPGPGTRRGCAIGELGGEGANAFYGMAVGDILKTLSMSSRA